MQPVNRRVLAKLLVPGETVRGGIVIPESYGSQEFQMKRLEIMASAADCKGVWVDGDIIWISNYGGKEIPVRTEDNSRQFVILEDEIMLIEKDGAAF